MSRLNIGVVRVRAMFYDEHMQPSFLEQLAVGGHSNSLGLNGEVIAAVLHDKQNLEALYGCLFAEDAWVRMRAADALEKICRVHPVWLSPYIDRLADDFGEHPQASIQWHLAQIYAQAELTPSQKQRAITWLQAKLASTAIDWIVAANAMTTLVAFTLDGNAPLSRTRQLLQIQRGHASKSVVRRADKLLAQLASPLPR
jgi:hypothetical protein